MRLCASVCVCVCMCVGGGGWGEWVLCDKELNANEDCELLLQLELS